MEKKEKINVRRICNVSQRNLSIDVREGLRLFGRHRKVSITKNTAIKLTLKIHWYCNQNQICVQQRTLFRNQIG